MTMRRASCVALALVSLLVVSVVDARSIPVLERRASDAFCQSFTSGCRQVAAQRSATANVVPACTSQITNSATSTYAYTFSCVIDGVESAQLVLDSTGAQQTQTVNGVATTTQTAAPLTVTSTVEQVISKTLTQPLTSTAKVTATVSLPAVTSTVTQVAAVTQIVQQQKRATKKQQKKKTSKKKTVIKAATAPSTARALAAVPPFCQAFTTSCSNVCIGARTTAKTNTCTQSLTNTRSYTLTCLCRAGQAATPNALSDVASKFKLPVVQTKIVSTSTVVQAAQSNVVKTQLTVRTSTVATTSVAVSTSTLTATVTVQAAPVTVTTTQTTTSTSTVTRSTSTTTTSSTSTSTTSIPSITSVAIPTTTAITTTIVTPTTSSVLPIDTPTTTTSLLTPLQTGRVAIRSNDGQFDGGYLTMSADGTLFTSTITNPGSAAIVFQAVQDPTSGLYQLQVNDGSGDVLSFELGYGVDASATMTAGSSTYAIGERTSSAQCSTVDADDTGVLIDNPCASYVFAAQPISTDGGVTTASYVRLLPNWSNDLPTDAADVVTQAFGIDTTGYALLLAADPDAFEQAYGIPAYEAALYFPA